MDTHPIEDEEHHLRTFLLRLERRLMDLSREMGVQENLHRVLKEQERELEERLLERERRLAEAHEVGRLYRPTSFALGGKDHPSFSLSCPSCPMMTGRG